jgi:serine/threonine-protein kinase
LVALCERTVIAGKYRLEYALAAGGMGAVWVARHLMLDEDVAVKFMSPSLLATPEARARFAREAHAAARLRSPHVVQILDYGVDDDVPYLVMELLAGEHLGERIVREGRLPLREVVWMTEQVARALMRAHRAGIVHRDLKPANIFLSRVDEEEIVKLLDFGIAKQLGAVDATQADVLVGSPQYMSPEQARGARDLDHRADLWSLAVILFRALTGAPAFEGETAIDVILQICTGPVPSALRVAPDLAPELDAFFRRALDRDPARRFGSARELADELAAIAARIDGAIERSGPRLAAASDATLRMPREAPDGDVERDVEAFLEQAFASLLSPGSSAVEQPPATVPIQRRPALRRVDPWAASGDVWAGFDGAAAWRAPPRVRGALAALIEEGFTALERGERDTARRVWTAALGLDPGNRALEANLKRL